MESDCSTSAYTRTMFFSNRRRIREEFGELTLVELF